MAESFYRGDRVREPAKGREGSVVDHHNYGTEDHPEPWVYVCFGAGVQGVVFACVENRLLERV